MTFTSDHIRTLAAWSGELGLTEASSAMYTLYHHMTVTKTASIERINAMAMSTVKTIRDTETDRAMFYAVMQSWGM